jgi:protein tyrosine/serine phosphatase
MAQQLDLSVQRKPTWAVLIEKSQNLYQVAPRFYRSAQLQESDITRIQALGIKTVVNLRAFHSDDALLKKTSITMYRVKIHTWHIEDEDVILALQLIRKAEKDGPVLLHCQHGADRTGLITAMYRMLYMGWSKEQALDELQHGGFGYHSVWKNIVTYLQNVDIEKIRDQVELFK